MTLPAVEEYDLDAERVWDLSRHPKQLPFIWDRSRFAIWQGGRGSTKTISGMWRILTTCYKVEDDDGNMLDYDDWEVRPEWVGADILIAAPVSKQLKRGPLERFDEVFDDTGLVLQRINGDSPRRHLEGDITVYFFNVGPQGEGAESWRGSAYAIFFPDETAQMPEKAFMLGNATLRQKRPNGTSYSYQTIITTTPLGENWLWRRLLNPETRATYLTRDGKPMYPDDRLFTTTSTTWESIEAGILDMDYVDSMGYTPGSMQYNEEVLGLVVSKAGLVFDQKWRLISDVNPAPNAFVAVYGGIDPGNIDPTAIIIAGIDLEGRIWVLREFYMANARMDEWIDKIGEWSKEFGVRRWYVDNDITLRMMKSANFKAYFPYKAKDAADDAVRYINNRIAQGSFNIDPSCRGLLSEMSGYKYKEVWSGEEVTFLQKVQQHQPDHAIDALRYAIFPLSAARAAQSYGKEVGFAIG